MAKKSDSLQHFFGGSDAATDEDLDLSLDPRDEDTDVTDASTTDEGVEGEIAVDVYEDDNYVVVVSPVAGVSEEDIEIEATDDSITITGERSAEHTTNHHGLHLQEIYWGAFSRTIELPVPVQIDKATATCEKGLLIVRIPKHAKAKKRVIKVRSGSSTERRGSPGRLP